jgi:hypothetical protein
MVVKQLEVEYPSVAADINAKAAQAAEDAPAEIAARGLNKRDHTVCHNFESANYIRIKEGVNYLRGVPGRPWLAAGPGKCARVSCSWNSAIWWCNDVS